MRAVQCVFPCVAGLLMLGVASAAPAPGEKAAGDPLLALLRLLRASTPDDIDALARLAQSTAPEDREALRRELLAQAPAQRSMWLQAKLQ